ncbi:PsbP-related protein [Clostridium brassicae]|uniref:PsbP-related protein n=1 Tax=Clostridium brassicae TaxID=2999072 RepID=A0ABT4DA70_9CLOT|nr:PsbP-related protein [Clostridium brassicae]MCY6959207.1 PsbP-related protein [Clostridium brassicae]
MKIILINKRRIEIVVIVFVLMISIFGIGKLFEERIKYVSFIQNNISSLKEYKALDGWLTYKLPEKWNTEIENSLGKEIIYHNNFKAEDLAINGVIQVWNIKNNLQEFLENSKQISMKQNNILDYKIKEINIDNKQGYWIRYVILSNDTYYVANEYFVKSDDRIVRISFFVKNQDFKEAFKALFDSIVQTITIHQS